MRKLLLAAIIAVCFLPKASFAFDSDTINGMATVTVYDAKCAPGSVSADSWKTMTAIAELSTASEKAEFRKRIEEHLAEDPQLFCAAMKLAHMDEQVKAMNISAANIQR